jgi:hypothetical protein
MNSLKSRSVKLSLLLGGLAALGSIPGCGSDNPTVTCGAGTVEKNSTCIPIDVPGPGGAPDSGGGGGTSAVDGGEPPVMNGGGGGSGGSGGEVDAPTLPSFEGVRAVAPASDSSLLVVWSPASYGDTDPADFVYEVFVALKSGAQNFAVPTVTSAPGATSALVTGLDADSSYFIVVRAVAPDDVRDENAVELEATPAEDIEPPTFDGATKAKAAGPTSVTLSWDAGADDQTPADALIYVAYVAENDPGTQDFSGPPIAVSEPGATELTVEGLDAADTTYHFVVRARDAAGNSDENTEEIDGTTGPDETAPIFSGCSLATATGATSAFLTWKPARDDVTLAKDIRYSVYAADASGEQDFTLPSAAAIGGTGVEVEDLSPSTTYYFVCRAEDFAGNSDRNTSERLTRTGDDGAPPVFGGVDALVKNVTANSVELTWTAASDDKSTPDQIVYDVFQATSSGAQVFDMPPIASSEPGATSIKLSNLAANQGLFWVVRARDKAGNQSQNVQEATAKTLVSFEQNIQQGILNPHCALSGCHTGLSPTGEMDLSEGFAGNSYPRLVNVASVGVPAKVRVKPSSTTDSYLYMKITGAAGIFGTIMPPPSTTDTLSQQEIQTIATWINQGAQNN